MKQFESLSELVPGQIYDIHCKQFDVHNKARLISFDTTGLNRDIAYFQFSDRDYEPINREQLKLMFKYDQYPTTVFALWGHDLKHNIITN